MPGCRYSTEQVGNTTTEPCFFVSTGATRFENHVLNLCLAYGGNKRTDETPTVFSINFRAMEPGLAPIIKFEMVLTEVASIPNASA